MNVLDKLQFDLPDIEYVKEMPSIVKGFVGAYIYEWDKVFIKYCSGINHILLHELVHSTDHEDRLNRRKDIYYPIRPYDKDKLILEQATYIDRYHRDARFKKRYTTHIEDKCNNKVNDERDLYYYREELICDSVASKLVKRFRLPISKGWKKGVAKSIKNYKEICKDFDSKQINKDITNCIDYMLGS